MNLPKYALRVSDAAVDARAIEAVCLRCGRRSRVDWSRFDPAARLVKLEARLRCRVCRNAVGNYFLIGPAAEP